MAVANAEVKVNKKKNWCICSPAPHPGSFRCRRHRMFYQWGRRGILQQQQERVPAPKQEAEAEKGVEGNKKKWCICSPTTHPGSFRCRHHCMNYQLGTMRTSHHTSSLVRHTST
ncbi:uncharacterized protein LOC110008119 [Amborella trichopoda]|uniref:uncharacterized protein LOC110008119 n=1 Tax=Amborella trichopoda TaxID=13333 RepID=UPI0009BF4D8C|nr:uncharacterized protein LOC110008119 [Amborella trichopoda]|eukprot:XP_020529341.1 uncharacterized protein LOC110008119 [Amborella trichopoda]